MKPEILAPAGSFEALKSAVRSGADAVYFGGEALNARRNASNFSDGEVVEAIDYCHKRNVKAHITVNTLVSDGEVPGVIEKIKEYAKAGADAFIIQDIGLSALVRHICPDVPLHASTQMSVQSAEGIKILENMGFSRAVLPRELSEKEIKTIADSVDLELECFVHGALCMCVSGQCLMSSILGGRSGNRGLCAQPCRLPFGVNEKGGYALSLKDLSLVDKISALADAGVDSLKIEGRMKRPEYVAAAVTACKNSISGKEDKAVTSALDAVFSRSGFTSGYFDGKTGRDMFGIRTKDDVTGAAPVLASLRKLYDGEQPLIPVDMTFVMRKGDYPALTVRSGNHECTCISEDLPSEALSKEATCESVSAQLKKCGGTQFYAVNIKCEIDRGLFFSVSEINKLRRNALCKLEETFASGKERRTGTLPEKPRKHKTGEKKLHVRFGDYTQITGDLAGVDRVIIPLDTPRDFVHGILRTVPEVAVEIPVNVFSNFDYFVSEALELKEAGVSLAVASNIDGIAVAKKAGMKFSSGFGMNIFNSYSLLEMEKAGAKDCLLSCELSFDEIEALGADIPRGVLVYGRLPLMVTRNCPVRTKLSCAECGKKSNLVDRMGISFPVRCKNGFSFVYNSRPLCVYDIQSHIKGVDYELLYFTVESGSECSEIISSCKEKRPPAYEYTRGLYNKKVL
ncbi:MAG: U32 family peptidase [Clostridia bacterium]|nr:U32 family peptidase [Clostridia bacterium]